MQTKLPKSIIKTFFIHAMKNNWNDNLTIHTSESDMSAINPEFIFLGMQDVEITVPQVDIVAAEISGWEKARAKLFAETEIKQQVITDKIQSLLCIDHK